MKNKEFINGLKNGFGFSLAITIVISILFGVYAFVEPSQGPSAGDNYIDNNSPLLTYSSCRTVTSGDTFAFVSANCLATEQVISGGCGIHQDASASNIIVNAPNANGWDCRQNTAVSVYIEARAICCIK